MYLKDNMEKEKSLVTGGAGFIGSHVVDRLVDMGHEVYVVDNLSNGKRSNVNPDAQMFKMDISDSDTFNKLREVDNIFHLAALARVQPSIQNPVHWHNSNVNGTLNVLEYAKRCGAKIVYSSTSSVYGDTDVLPTPEDHPKNPMSPYALQKLMGEMYVKLYADLYGVDYTILRYFNVYGERQLVGGAYSSVLGIFLDKKANGEKLPIRNTGEQKRDYTYVGDVADANILAMQWDKDVYNIGAGNNYSVSQIAEMVGGEKEYAGEVLEPFATLADNTKAKQAGWQPKGNVKEWISDNLS